MFSISLLGCGRIGKLHAEVLSRSKECRFIGVYDTYQLAAEELAKKYNCSHYQTAEEAIAASDAVVIASSTPTHADMIELAVKMGKAVFCEKPIDLSLDRVRQTRKNIGDAAKNVHIGFNRRFDKTHRSARLAYENGQIGDLHQVIITSRDPAPPSYDYLAQSGGIFRDMTIHDFDLARYMLGEDPVEVFAVGNVLIDPVIGEKYNDHDTVMIIMRTKTGKQCHINNSRSACFGHDQRVELFGSKGMVISDNQTENSLRSFNAQASSMHSPLQAFFIERYGQAYADGLNSFIKSVKNKVTPEVNFFDGEKAIILADAALASIKEKKMINVVYE